MSNSLYGATDNYVFIFGKKNGEEIETDTSLHYKPSKLSFSSSNHFVRPEKSYLKSYKCDFSTVCKMRLKLVVIVSQNLPNFFIFSRLKFKRIFFLLCRLTCKTRWKYKHFILSIIFLLFTLDNDVIIFCYYPILSVSDLFKISQRIRTSGPVI